MKYAFLRLICRILVVSMALLPFQTVYAGMIGADQIAASMNRSADQNTVLSALSRSDVQRQLQSLGLDPQTAKNRVGAMTDQEVHSLAGKINALPAGGSSGWAVVLIIVIAAVLYYNWK